MNHRLTRVITLIATLLISGACWSNEHQDGLRLIEQQNYDEAFKKIRAAAIKGNADAMADLGKMHFNGHGTPVNKVEASKWLKKAGEKGNVSGMLMMGFYYSNGWGEESAVNHKKAFDWFLKAAMRDDPDATLWVGVGYLGGKGVAPDAKESIKWLLKAHESGVTEAAEYLGLAHDKQNDYEQAIFWMKKSNSNAAKFYIGNAYYSGKGVPKNHTEALKYYKEYVKNEPDSTAMLMLSLIYASGIGIEQNLVAAHMWGNLSLALKGKDREVVEKGIETLERMMSSKQISEAQRLAKVCRDQSYVGCVAQATESPDEATCKNYGFTVDTAEFSRCKQTIATAKAEAEQRQAQYELELKRYEAEKQAYERQLAQYEEQKRQAEKQKLIRFGLALMGGQSPSFAENLNNANRAMHGLPPQPPREPVSRNFTIIKPSGGAVNCNVFGSIVQCH